MKGKVGGQWNKIFMEIFRSMSRGFLLLSPVKSNNKLLIHKPVNCRQIHMIVEGKAK